MNQKGFVSIVLIAVIVALAGTIGYFAFTKKQLPFIRQINTSTPIQQNSQTSVKPTVNTVCKNLYDEIENDLDKANYCGNNSDCDVLVLGGIYVKFGCYHFVNKGIDKNKFYEKMQTYNQSCTDIIDRCAPAPKPSCVAGRCAYIQ